MACIISDGEFPKEEEVQAILDANQKDSPSTEDKNTLAALDFQFHRTPGDLSCYNSPLMLKIDGIFTQILLPQGLDNPLPTYLFHEKINGSSASDVEEWSCLMEKYNSEMCSLFMSEQSCLCEIDTLNSLTPKSHFPTILVWLTYYFSHPYWFSYPLLSKNCLLTLLKAYNSIEHMFSEVSTTLHLL